MPRTHTLSYPSSLMVFIVGSFVPILHQNLACPPRYPLRKGECCRCRVEPGVIPTFGVDGRTVSFPHFIKVSNINTKVASQNEGQRIMKCQTVLATKVHIRRYHGTSQNSQNTVREEADSSTTRLDFVEFLIGLSAIHIYTKYNM